MAAPWDLLVAVIEAKKKCAQDVASIQKSCDANHDQGHVVACPDCWNQLIVRMRNRYLASEQDWFVQRSSFLKDMEDMFNKTPKSDQAFSAIEDRINDERRDWYREAIRNIDLDRATRSPFEGRSLQQRLNDESIPAEELVSELDGFLYHASAPNEDEFNQFIDRLANAQTSNERNEIFIDLFFRPKRKPEDAAKCQKYIDMIRNGTPVKEALDAMVREGQSSKGDQDQRKKLQTKLEELKRAKAAHELAQSKRDKIRQEKAQAAPSDDEQVPPCSVCAKKPNGPSYFTCPICHSLYDQYGIGKGLVIFCCQECHDEGYESHSEQHMCSAGDDCVTMQDDDVDMDAHTRVTVFCKECVETLDTHSIFCSSKCFDNQFQRHRDGVHIPERKKAGMEVDDESQLEYDPEDATKYRAKNIEEHIVDVLDGLQEQPS